MDNFDEIRPYNDEEAYEAFLRLMEDARFQDAMVKYLPGYTLDEMRRDFATFHSVDELQVKFFKKWVDMFVSQTTSGVTTICSQPIESGQAYLYISNHRDITFDTSMLEYYFFNHHIHSSRIAIGDNLINTPVLGEIARINRMFLVMRSGTLREKLQNTKRLSAYIQKSILEEHESVWIAQRDGRTKDGYDYTKQGLVKMCSMGHDNDLIETLKKLKITPMAISYEYEPCDQLKARELALSENSHYEKRPGEDFDSIKHGLFDPKGRVSLVIGKTLNEELDEIPTDISNNDKLFHVCKLIDHQIYENYKLYPSNYIANDLMHNTSRYTEFYTAEEKEKFEQYLQRKSCVQDVSREKMRNYLLQIYGTPVDNHYNKPINTHQ